VLRVRDFAARKSSCTRVTDPTPLPRWTKHWREWRGFVLFVAVMLVFRSAIADWNQIPSGSMKPSILVGDRIVVDKIAYDLRVPFTLQRLARWSHPKRGDVVTFPSPEDEITLIKRVAGLPGDVIEMRDNVLIVNGEVARYAPMPQAEIDALPIDGKDDYRFFYEDVAGMHHAVMLSRNATFPDRKTFPPMRVPDGQFLMLGDNRDDSKDSRYIGCIDGDRITGRAEAIAFSLDTDHHWAPRLDRFFSSLP